MPLLRLASALIAASLAFAGAVPAAHAYITPDEFIGAGAGGGGNTAQKPAGDGSAPRSVETDVAAQADKVQVDGVLVPLPEVRMAEEDKEYKEDKEDKETDDRAAKVQERIARRLERGTMEGTSGNIPLSALMPEPTHAAAPEADASRRFRASPPEPPRPAYRQAGSVREQIASNALPPTGAAHTMILVVSALVVGSSFLFQRWATRKT